MNHEELEKHLFVVLKKLDRSIDQILKTMGYTNDAKRAKMLAELIKEQIKNENSLHSTSSVR